MRRHEGRIRRTTFGILAASAVLASGCGSSGGRFANNPRPATPVNLTVYVNDARVSVSPAAVGAGPVVFIVTNQASHTESVTVTSSGGGETLASTGPINPQATSQVTVDFQDPGSYTVTTSKVGSTEAARANASSIQPATILIGKPRPSASNQLLQP